MQLSHFPTTSGPTAGRFTGPVTGTGVNPAPAEFEQVFAEMGGDSSFGGGNATVDASRGPVATEADGLIVPAAEEAVRFPVADEEPERVALPDWIPFLASGVQPPVAADPLPESEAVVTGNSLSLDAASRAESVHTGGGSDFAIPEPAAPTAREQSGTTRGDSKPEARAVTATTRAKESEHILSAGSDRAATHGATGQPSPAGPGELEESAGNYFAGGSGIPFAAAAPGALLLSDDHAAGATPLREETAATVPELRPDWMMPARSVSLAAALAGAGEPARMSPVDTRMPGFEAAAAPDKFMAPFDPALATGEAPVGRRLPPAANQRITEAPLPAVSVATGSRIQVGFQSVVPLVSPGPDVPALTRPIVTKNSPANFAAANPAVEGAGGLSAEPPLKQSLDVVATSVTSGSPGVGIRTAKSTPSMKPSAFVDSSVPAVLSPVDRGMAFGIEHLELRTEASPLTESPPVASAAEAVDVVLAAADRLEGVDHSTVNLKLSVGGSDLAVRIEVRADEVRTTFRTDSPELQSALTREWQSLHTDGASRPFRLAEPVFARGEEPQTSFLGDQASRHGHSGHRSPQPEFATLRSTRGSGTTGTPDLGVLPRAGVVSTSRLLHTLA